MAITGTRDRAVAHTRALRVGLATVLLIALSGVAYGQCMEVLSPPAGVAFQVYDRFHFLKSTCPGVGNITIGGTVPPGLRVACAASGGNCEIQGVPVAAGTFRFTVSSTRAVITVQIAPSAYRPVAFVDFEAAPEGESASALRDLGVTFSSPDWFVGSVPAGYRPTDVPNIPWRHPEGKALIAGYGASVPPGAALEFRFSRPVARAEFTMTGVNYNGMGIIANCTYHGNSYYLPGGVYILCTPRTPTDTFRFPMNSLAANGYFIVDHIAGYETATLVPLALALRSITPATAPAGARITINADSLIECLEPPGTVLSIPIGVVVGETTTAGVVTDCNQIQATVPPLPDGATTVTVIANDGRTASIPFTVGPFAPRRRLVIR